MREFYKGKKVFITGHTGFKGAYLTRVLCNFGAKVRGYSLPAESPSAFDALNLKGDIEHVEADIRDSDRLLKEMSDFEPEIIFHLAAQPIVREGYLKPRYTFETNVLGTVNLLEAARQCGFVRSIVNVTTDKVYYNDESGRAFTEDDKLDGFDPYSNSKSCSDIVTHCYYLSYFKEKGVAVSSMRAGNVIGGGDFAKDRIIPDCYRAAIKGEIINVRNPYSVRPYQHVLEPIFAYLSIAKRQYEDPSFAGSYNVGPEEDDVYETRKLVDTFVKFWGDGLKWQGFLADGPHEANYLKLNCDKLKKAIGRQPVWNTEKAVEKTVEWYKTYARGGDVLKITDEQIWEFYKKIK